MSRRMLHTVGAVLFALQGVVTALAPQLSTRMVKRMLGENFENTERLEAKPSYLRQIRALGIGMAAAGVAGAVMERVSDDDETGPAETDETSGEERIEG